MALLGGGGDGSGTRRGGKDPPGEGGGGARRPRGRGEGGREEGGGARAETDGPARRDGGERCGGRSPRGRRWFGVGAGGPRGVGWLSTASSSAVTYVQSVPLNIMRVISIAIASSKTIYGYCSQLVPKWIKGIQYCMQCGTWWQKPWQKWWYFSIFFWGMMIFSDICRYFVEKRWYVDDISNIFLMFFGSYFYVTKVLKYYHFHSLHAMCHQLHLLFFVIINWHHLVLFINWHHLYYSLIDTIWYYSLIDTIWYYSLIDTIWYYSSILSNCIFGSPVTYEKADLSLAFLLHSYTRDKPSSNGCILYQTVIQRGGLLPSMIQWGSLLQTVVIQWRMSCTIGRRKWWRHAAGRQRLPCRRWSDSCPESLPSNPLTRR